ncbi:MAG: MBL fold metallo-hydrolase [Bacteroidales bacterium]|nr:MBL fold metallo-hydrolase [Bacteroidales bacterium]
MSGKMHIYRHIFSPIEVNTYVISGEEGSCIIIDCGCYGPEEEKRLEEFLSSHGLTPVMLLNTHCHLDHIFGNDFVLRKYGLRSMFHPCERYNHSSSPKHALMFGLTMEEPPEPERELTDGETITAAGLTIEVIAVPGHSPGGVAFYIRDHSALFTGDALFAGSIGRSDLPGGNHEQLLENISSRLFVLPPDTVVYPGHGPATTIGEEIRSNPFFS